MTRAAIGLLALALLGCDTPAPSEPRTDAPALAEPPASASPATPDLAAPMIGVLVPEAEVVVVASGFARVQRLDLAVGDHVDEGDVIAEMDVRGDRGELAVATAAWKASSAELERLELELEQAKAKREDVEQLEDYVSKAELREQRYAEKLADARKRSAGASLSQQRSKMEEASARIAEAELRAPFAGSVADRYVDEGATASTGDPIVRLISDARVVRFAVPETRSAALRLGAEVQVAFPELGELAGEVVTIAPEIQVGTRLIFAEAKLERSADLRVGTVGRVRFVSR
ncbi:efflux RND transporter periplasmic adaptor subunit [Nannocystaceae bacterium ST9]